MAITRTRTVLAVEVNMSATPDPEVRVTYQDTFDDSTDDQLPATTHSYAHFERYTVTGTDDDGNPVQSATDMTGEDQVVQDICAAVWTD